MPASGEFVGVSDFTGGFERVDTIYNRLNRWTRRCGDGAVPSEKLLCRRRQTTVALIPSAQEPACRRRPPTATSKAAWAQSPSALRGASGHRARARPLRLSESTIARGVAHAGPSTALELRLHGAPEPERLTAQREAGAGTAHSPATSSRGPAKRPTAPQLSSQAAFR